MGSPQSRLIVQQRSFYLALAAVPTSYILYKISRPGTDQSPHPFTRIINGYADLQSTWVERNAMHTKAVERVAHEKNLFFNTPQPNHHELRFPEYVTLSSRWAYLWDTCGRLEAIRWHVIENVTCRCRFHMDRANYSVM